MVRLFVLHSISMTKDCGMNQAWRNVITSSNVSGLQATSMIDTMDNMVLREFRSKESFRHALEIVKPLGTLDHILLWCKAELAREWRWTLQESSGADPGHYIFYFDSEKDYCAFVMKWK